MPEKKDPAGIIPDWFNRDMDFDGDCDLLDMTLYEDQFREEEEETPSYLEDEEDELEDDDALMERLSEMDETEREFFLMDHPTIQQRIEDDFELEEFMSELDTESENDDFSNEDDDFYDEDEEFDDEDDDASDEFEDDLYTGKNAWREKYRENPITWLVDPVDYDDEQEYLEAGAFLEGFLEFFHNRYIAAFMAFGRIFCKIRRIIIPNERQALFLVTEQELPNCFKKHSATQLVFQLPHIHHRKVLHYFSDEFLIQGVKDMRQKILFITKVTVNICFVDIRSLDDGFSRSFIQTVFCNDYDCLTNQSALHIIVLHGK